MAVLFSCKSARRDRLPSGCSPVKIGKQQLGCAFGGAGLDGKRLLLITSPPDVRGPFRHLQYASLTALCTHDAFITPSPAKTGFFLQRQADVRIRTEVFNRCVRTTHRIRSPTPSDVKLPYI